MAETCERAPGRIAENVMHFARLLRAAGLPLGPGQVIEAIAAVEAVGLRRRDDLYWALHAVLVTRREQHELFDQAFRLFWRNPEIPERLNALLLPRVEVPREESGEKALRRLAEAIGLNEAARREQAASEIEIDAALTFSAEEQLRRKDFAQMSAEELAQAKAALARLRLAFPERPTRRHRSAARGARIDLRASIKASLRTGGDLLTLRRRAPRRQRPPIVALCDISGSMGRYSRMALHFLHALTNDRDRVHVFLFGTRLSNVTRQMRRRDVDEALARVAQSVSDWDGGTRIGQCLRAFNLRWSRRVLGQNAVVLLITDGLDRDAGADLGAEIERLHKSCRRLIWLNPLLSYEGFAPKAAGVRAILPHVDEFRPVHNIESLSDLAAALSAPAARILPAERRPARHGRARHWEATA